MSSTVTFSVIIPAYNAAKTICASVESCLSQSLPPDEIIVVDDGSADGTAALLLTTFGERVQLIRLLQNAGPSAARNAGLNAAHGTHICFQDADDVWHKDKLRIMREVIGQYPDAALWFHDRTTDAMPEAVSPPYPVRCVPFLSLLPTNIIATPCAVLTNTSIRYDERMRYCEDYDFFLKQCYPAGAVYCDLMLAKLGRPLLTAGGQSGNRWAMRRGELQSYSHLSRLHAGFVFLIPFLWMLSLLKHIVFLVIRPSLRR